MSKVSVFNITGEKTGDLELSSNVFDVEIRELRIHSESSIIVRCYYYEAKKHLFSCNSIERN